MNLVAVARGQRGPKSLLTAKTTPDYQENIACGPVKRGEAGPARWVCVSRTTLQAPRRLAVVVHANRANMPRAVGGFLKAPTPLSDLLFPDRSITWLVSGHYLGHHSYHWFVLYVCTSEGSAHRATITDILALLGLGVSELLSCVRRA